MPPLLPTETGVSALDPSKAAAVLAFFLIAFLVHQLAPRLGGPVVRVLPVRIRRRRASAEREATVSTLVAHLISLLAFIVAGLAAIKLFVAADTLVWVVGLFSAAFGLAARPLVSDYLTGISLIFEDTFSVGDKIGLPDVEGVVEAVNLRTTLIRSTTGELYVVPNGEVRIVRNFTRGKFSTANITIQIDSADLPRAVEVLEALAEEAVVALPNLVRPWQVISSSGKLGAHTELTLVCRYRFGQAAEMRPRLLAFVQERLIEAGVDLED